MSVTIMIKLDDALILAYNENQLRQYIYSNRVICTEVQGVRSSSFRVHIGCEAGEY